MKTLDEQRAEALRLLTRPHAPWTRREVLQQEMHASPHLAADLLRWYRSRVRRGKRRTRKRSS